MYRKGRYYYVDFKTKNGRRHRKSLGTNKKVAQLAFNELELKMEKQQRLGIVECKKVRFEDFAEKYLSYSRDNKKESSHQRDIYSFRALMPFFRGRQLTSITPEMIEQYKSKRLNQDHVGPACVNRELHALSALFRQAMIFGYAQENPMKKVKSLREPPGRVRYLEKDEYHRLVDACSSRTVKTAVLLALNTGMRKQEILSLRAEDVFLGQRKIIVRDSKNNESRIIPMNRAVYETLKDVLPSKGYIFSNGNGGRIKYIDQGFKDAVRKANLVDFRFHDCRHHFASWLSIQGWNLLVIQRLLGVKSLKMVKRYAHLSEANMVDAVNSLDKNFENGTNMAPPEKLALEV
jgi:integrase